MLEKIFDPLGGGGVISTAKAIGRVLQLALEPDARSALRGLYPGGGGAGYAGGIMSAATDGIRCAEALIADL